MIVGVEVPLESRAALRIGTDLDALAGKSPHREHDRLAGLELRAEQLAAGIAVVSRREGDAEGVVAERFDRGAPER